MIAFARTSRPTTGAYVWFGIMLTSWSASAALTLFSEDTLADVWKWVQDLPLVVELLVWFLTLPWMLALAVWESGWEDALRLPVVLLIAAGWTIVSIPRAPGGHVDPS